MTSEYAAGELQSWRQASNPFATRFVAPQQQLYQFCDGTTVDDLVERLRANHWRGQIVGRHGTGKSTLLEALVPALVNAGRTIVRFELHDAQRRLPRMDHQLHGLPDLPLQPDLLLIVDGYEQLSRWARWKIRRRCRRAGWGLLLTAHVDQSWPHLYQTRSSLPLVQNLVGSLTQFAPPELRPKSAQVRTAFQQHEGNLREVWMELFELVECRRRQPPVVDH